MAELEINNVDELKVELEKAIENSPNKPTEEEIRLAGEEFEYASKVFPTMMWPVGEVTDARAFCDYLSHYLRNRLFWTKNGWMGVVKLDEELKAASNLLNGKEPLKLGYQALEFIYYSLMNPGGVGLQSAQDFESESENYLPVMEAVSVTLEQARNKIKEIQFLQDRYAAMNQGFYLELEPTEPIVDEMNIGTMEIDLSKPEESSTEPLPGEVGDLTVQSQE
jgi:hypothetical protein